MAEPRPAHYIDVQPLLRRVCDGMAVGELLAADSFNLHDAMQAIEIGDAKMDIGLRREEVGTVEELVGAGQAPVDLGPPQLQALLDRLLAMEATWHAGSMLPQTVYTSLHMLDTDRLKVNVVLHAYCVGLRSTCTAVSDLIVSSQVCEDEDISVHAFGVRLDPPGAQPMKAAQRALEEAIAWLEGAAMGDAAARAALRARLRLRWCLLQALLQLQRPSRQALQDVVELCTAAATELEAVQRSVQPEAVLAAAPGFVPGINHRHMGLVPPRPVDVAALPVAVDHWRGVLGGLAGACEALLRVASWPALREALVRFAAGPGQPIVRSAMHSMLVKPLVPPPIAPPEAAAPAQGAAANGAAGCVPEPQQQAQAEAGAAPDAEEESAAPPSWCPSRQMLASEFGLDVSSLRAGGDAALFFEQCAIAVQGWCHTMCLNRCRQRRRLRRLLEDWRNMTDHSFNAEASEEMQAALARGGWRWQPRDAEGNQVAGPLSAWVEAEAAGTMLGHLQLGGPLELYALQEYCSVYWYCDFLLSVAHQDQTELHSMRPVPPALPRAPARMLRGSTRLKAAANAAIAAAEKQAALDNKHAAATLLSQLDLLMCGGVVKAALGLERAGLLAPAPAPLSSARERFEQRFACFAQLIRPEPLRYEDFLAATQGEGLQPGQFLALALDAFAKADRGAAAVGQGGGERWLSEGQRRHLAGIRRIATQNMMALKLLLASLGTESASGSAEHAAAFRISWDIRVAQQHSAAMYFPCLRLQSAGNAHAPR